MSTTALATFYDSVEYGEAVSLTVESNAEAVTTLCDPLPVYEATYWTVIDQWSPRGTYVKHFATAENVLDYLRGWPHDNARPAACALIASLTEFLEGK